MCDIRCGSCHRVRGWRCSFKNFLGLVKEDDFVTGSGFEDSHKFYDFVTGSRFEDTHFVHG